MRRGIRKTFACPPRGSFTDLPRHRHPCRGQGLLARSEIQGILGIGKTRFFALLKKYRHDPEGFSVAYERHSPGRLSVDAEAAIERELLREKAIVEDKRLPISGYNYSALRDRLQKKGIKVSVTTIIERANVSFVQPERKTLNLAQNQNF